MNRIVVIGFIIFLALPALGQKQVQSVVSSNCVDCGGTGGGGTVPPTPPNPTASSNTCGNILLTRTGSPGSGVAWYWQAPGETQSTSYEGPTFVATASGTYRIRAMRVSSGEWSTSAGFVTVTLNTTAPPSITNTSQQLVNTICENTTLNFLPTSSVSNTTYTWSSTVSGTVSGVTTSGSGTIHDTPLNTGNADGTIAYTITPFAGGGCTGPSVNYVVTVHPRVVIAPLNATLDICTGMTYKRNNTSNVPSTTYSWTVASPGISGASAGSGTSINQTLTNNSPGDLTATYTINGTANGCTGPSLTEVVIVSPLPLAAAQDAFVFSGQTTAISITNPNNVNGTVYQWIPGSTTTVSGAASGTGSIIAQKLNKISQGTSDGQVTYQITPLANGCSGPSISTNATVYAVPVISASQNYVTKNLPVSLDAGAGYTSYLWQNSALATLGNTRSINVSQSGTYAVTVSKPGASITVSYQLSDQFSNMNMNYIVTNLSMVDNITDASTLETLPVEQSNQSIAYFDGFGRHLQEVNTQGSPTKNDVVIPVNYDALGRETKKYLPVATGKDGRYKSTLLDNNGAYLTDFYSTPTDNMPDDARPFSETVFEPSPLNRPDKDYGPGTDWYTKGKFVQHQYLYNIHGTDAGQERIIAWKFDVTTDAPILNSAIQASSSEPGYYASGMLDIKSTKDEHGHEAREYIDKLGQVILKKVQVIDSATNLNSTDQWAQTYYIYDDFGNLVSVLPPEAVKLVLLNY